MNKIQHIAVQFANISLPREDRPSALKANTLMLKLIPMGGNFYCVVFLQRWGVIQLAIHQLILVGLQVTSGSLHIAESVAHRWVGSMMVKASFTG